MYRRKKYSLKEAEEEYILSAECITSTCKSTDDLKENAKSNYRSISCRSFLGFFYIFMCSIFITLSSVIVKKLNYIDPGQLSFIRNFGVFVGSLPIAVYYNKNILGPKEFRIALITRSLLGATALYLNLMAFRYLPLAEAAVIMSTLPALAGVTARLYLKEPCGLVQACATVLTVCGVLLSIQIPELIKKRQNVEFNKTYIIGLACAVGCVFILSATFVLVRKMKDVHFSITVIYSGFLGMLENGAIAAAVSSYSSPRCGYDTFLILLIAAFGFLGLCGLILAIQTEAVGIVTVTKASLDITIAMVFQVIFFNTHPNIYNAGGAILVVLCIGVIGIRKWLLEMPEEATLRKRLKYLLL
ncbi:solute carrier family 35 member G1-like [Stegodyphus dumicola]|uniref:solute carrier family 35 member G1-like n=1 Tax=Stegodyphus dumicola TaxID=202533 RepID=UPI0015A9FA05|nr:solute carrier family 35 member G1-like [Stegodyphus dumicola]